MAHLPDLTLITRNVYNRNQNTCTLCRNRPDEYSIHGNYAEYFESARAESVRQLGFTYKELEAMHIFMPIVEIHCKFVRPAHYDDLLTVKVILKELPVNHRIEFHHEVYNEKGKLLTIGRVVLYFINSATKLKTRLPEQLYEKLTPFFQNS